MRDADHCEHRTAGSMLMHPQHRSHIVASRGYCLVCVTVCKEHRQPCDGICPFAISSATYHDAYNSLSGNGVCHGNDDGYSER